MKTPAQTCGQMGDAHAYLGHFKNAEHLNKGHNTTETIPAIPGHKAIKFKKGALRSELGVPQGQKIPAAKMAAAASGQDGPLAKKRAMFAKNVLHR